MKLLDTKKRVSHIVYKPKARIRYKTSNFEYYGSLKVYCIVLWPFQFLSFEKEL